MAKLLLENLLIFGIEFLLQGVGGIKTIKLSASAIQSLVFQDIYIYIKLYVKPFIYFTTQPRIYIHIYLYKYIHVRYIIFQTIIPANIKSPTNRWRTCIDELFTHQLRPWHITWVKMFPGYKHTFLENIIKIYLYHK